MPGILRYMATTKAPAIDLRYRGQQLVQEILDRIAVLEGSGAGSPAGKIKSTVVAGTTSATNIAIAGIATNDKLLVVMRLDRDATAANINISSVLSEATIPTAGNIQLSTTNTTGDSLLVLYYDVSA